MFYPAEIFLSKAGNFLEGTQQQGTHAPLPIWIHKVSVHGRQHVSRLLSEPAGSGAHQLDRIPQKKQKVK